VGRGWRGRVAPLVAALDEGRSVGMVTDGDPSLYSTFAHAAAAVLEARPATELAVVPGVPSMCAAAAVEARPLAVGAERLAVLPASRLAGGELEAAVAVADTVVLLKAGAAMGRLRALLEGPARGWSVRYARRVGLEGEAHADSLDETAADYMALVILRRPRPARA
jgi:precorrin-2/cobalt-factor-2 C20-methyltransferase